MLVSLAKSVAHVNAAVSSLATVYGHVVWACCTTSQPTLFEGLPLLCVFLCNYSEIVKKKYLKSDYSQV